jgi:hypothetical protein
VLRSSGEIALCVREDSAEAQKSKNPLRIRSSQSSGGTTSRRTRAAKLRVKEFAERRGAKVEAFGFWKFFQVWEESAQKLRREHNSRQIGWRKEIWTVGFYVQEGAQEKRTEGEIVSRWISFRNPVSRWIG